jgi:hypothetical protein
VRAREILDRKTSSVEQRQRERVAQRECRGRAGGGREPERTGLGVDARVEVDVRALRERRVLVAGERDQLRALAFQMRQQRHQLVGFAGVRDEQHDVVARDHAEIAVARLGRVHEERRRAGGSHGRGDLARDMTGLADADHDDAAAAVEQRADSSKEGSAEAPVQRADCGGLRREHIAAQRERTLRVETAHGRRRRHDRCGHALKYT